MTDLTFDIDSARDDLGTGYGSGSTIAALSRGLFRSRLILLRLLITEAAQRHRDAAADAGLDAAYGALADLQAGHPETVRALVLYPHTGAWLNHALRRVTGAGDADSPVPMWADLCYLGWLAASGAVTAGGSGSMTLVMRNGEVMLPRFGLAKLDADERCGYSELTWNDRGELAFRGDHGELVVESPAVEDNAQWLPLRRLRSGAADSEPVYLDDLDPFRDFSEPFVVRGQTERLPRLTQAEAAGWQANFAAASALLERDLPRYFEPMRAGLRTIVPLTVQPMLLSASSTANSSFGCVFSSAPADSSQLALTLVHEFQHNKFDLITSQTTLVEPDRTCRFYAPWRDDPRPIMALLHGIYSFFGVAEFWRVHRTDYHQPMSAHADYEYWRVQVESAIAEALASGLLTADGERFMATLRAGMRAWRDDDVPARARRSVADVATAHRVYWRVRNARPDPAGIAEFAGHWAAGSAAPAVLPTSHPADQELLPDSYHRLPLQLALRQLDDAQSCADPESGDGALAAGDAARAVALYTHDLRADAARPQPWAGLALALPTLYPETDFAVLHARPEVVAYLYQAATARGEYSVVELVRWLTGQAAVG